MYEKFLLFPSKYTIDKLYCYKESPAFHQLERNALDWNLPFEDLQRIQMKVLTTSWRLFSLSMCN